MPKASPRSRGATELAATSNASAGATSFIDAIAGLDVQLHRLANELAREILERELQRRLADRKASAVLADKAPKRRGRPPKEPPAKKISGKAARGGKASKAAAASDPSQLALQLPPATPAAAAAVASDAPKPAEPARAAAPPMPELPLTSGGKRIAWNRDTVVNALVPYVTKRMEVDTSFLKRHGPKGLVPAAIRFFGRLPAAINVACLRAAELAKQQEAAAAAQEGGA